MGNHRVVPPSIRRILVTRLDGLGDVVLCTTLLRGLHQRWPDAQIRLLVRPQLATAAQILPDWVEVVPLPFDPRDAIGGREEELAGALRSVAESSPAEVVILAEYNRVWASELVALLQPESMIVAFDTQTGLNAMNRGLREKLKLEMPRDWQLVKAEYESREPLKYRELLKSLEIETDGTHPSIELRDADRIEADHIWRESGLPAAKTVVLFPASGEGLKRSLLPQVWVQWAAHLAAHHPVVFLGSASDAEVLDAIYAVGVPATVKRLSLPPQGTGLLAAMLASAGAYIGADTGPMHIAAALEKPTLGVFGGGTLGSFQSGRQPERFLPTGTRAAAVRMPLGCFGCLWQCAFDERFCLTRIPVAPLLEAGDAFLSHYLTGGQNADPLSLRIFDLQPPQDLPTVLLGPAMRQHHQFLQLKHDLIEHHEYLARILHDMTRQNVARDEAISHINNVLAEMTRQNQARDEAISVLNKRR